MKIWLPLLLTLAMTFPLAACGPADSPDNSQDAGAAPEQTSESPEIAGETEIPDAGMETEPPDAGAEAEDPDAGAEPEPAARQIQVQFDGGTVVYALNDSAAADALLAQLPLTVAVEDYSTNEKIFYPPQALDSADAPPAEGGAGVLAYYAPWGDVVMFYDSFRANAALYELGHAVSGAELISEMSGDVTVEAAE